MPVLVRQSGAISSDSPACAIYLLFDLSRTITVAKSGGEGCDEHSSSRRAATFANSQTVLTNESIGLPDNGEWPPSGQDKPNAHSIVPHGTHLGTNRAGRCGGGLYAFTTGGSPPADADG
jgi:hypothetical protein